MVSSKLDITIKEDSNGSKQIIKAKRICSLDTIINFKVLRSTALEHFQIQIVHKRDIKFKDIFEVKN